MTEARVERVEGIGQGWTRRAVAIAAAAGIIAPLSTLAGAMLQWNMLRAGAWLASWPLLLAGLFAPYVASGVARLRTRGARRVEIEGDELRLRTVAGVTRCTGSLSDVPLVWRIGAREVGLLTYDGNELRLRFATDAEAVTFLEDARRRTLRSCRAYTVRVDGHLARLVRACWSWATFSAMGSTLLVLGVRALPVAAGLAALAWLTSASPRRITFGADGVTLRGRLRRRYVPYRDVESVEARSRGLRYAVRLRLRDGRSALVGRFFDAGRAHLVRALLEEGLGMVERGREAGAEVADLARGDEGLDGFLQRLGALTRGTYRAPTLSLDRLFDVMRNPAADPVQRASAAVALRSDPRGVARIRVVADVSANPAVRSALEQLAADEQLEAAHLEQLLTRVARPG